MFPARTRFSARRVKNGYSIKTVGDKFGLLRFKYGPVCMLRVMRDVCDGGYEWGWEHALPAPGPAVRRFHATVRAQSVPCPRSSSHPTGPCPSLSERRRQSPNGSPPPERARDRRGRRGVGGEECGGVSAGGMAVAPPVRRRAFRVRSPTTPPDAPERGAEAADTRRTRAGLRALCREYPSNCCPQTDADSRLRGAGQIRICQTRVRRGVARFGDNVGACPAERPAGPCRQTHAVHPQIFTKCLKTKKRKTGSCKASLFPFSVRSEISVRRNAVLTLRADALSCPSGHADNKASRGAPWRSAPPRRGRYRAN